MKLSSKELIMDYKQLDVKNFSDWQQVINETHTTLSYQQCLQLKSYVEKYQNHFVEMNPDDDLPKDLLDAKSRLNKQIHQLKTSQKRSPAETYIIPIVAIIIGGAVGFWLTQS
jgi:hypothetical protein